MTKTIAALALTAFAGLATIGAASAETVIIHRHDGYHGGYHRHFHPHPHFREHRTVIIRR